MHEERLDHLYSASTQGLFKALRKLDCEQDTFATTELTCPHLSHHN